MKFLVLGATGMAGHTISIYLSEMGHNVTAFSREPFPYCNNIIGDAMDMDFMTSLFQKEEPDLVINCIGVLNQACEKEPARAVFLNSFLPHYIADTLKSTNSRLIHLSTDCVFSGKAAPYTETSFRDGETFYDRTKALGEIEDNKNITFRNSIIGPDLKEDGIGLFNWFMKQDRPINGYSKAIWTGVTTLTLAKAIEKVAFERITGIYNLVNNISISKFELLTLLNQSLRNGAVEISESEALSIDKSLVNTRDDFLFGVPNYNEMVLEMKEWIIGHKVLYPHYFNNNGITIK